MEIKSTLTNHSGQVLSVIYKDINSEKDLIDKKITGVHAYCFYENKLIVVYSEKKGYWTPPGGKVEKNEDLESAVIREVKEETNMRVVCQRFIGYQDISEPQGLVSQTRSVCIVEPYGDFISDPDGDITEIKLIEPKDYKKYFDWGEIGDHIMKRALQIKEEMEFKKT
ncbi:MAG: NUDIX hydrolase [Patescibacteria group bacterium]